MFIFSVRQPMHLLKKGRADFHPTRVCVSVYILLGPRRTCTRFMVVLIERFRERWGCIVVYATARNDSHPMPLDDTLRQYVAWFSLGYPSTGKHNWPWTIAAWRKLMPSTPSFSLCAA